MRRKGRTNFEYEAEMAADCDRAFRDALSICDSRCTVYDVAALAVTMPSKRYWVSEAQAYRVINKMRRHGVGSISRMIHTKWMLYMNIYLRVRESQRANESLRDAVYRVCGEQAPELYMSAGSLLVRLCGWRRRGMI